ncbi:unnamed protein product [Amoebophrya sp. A120]|nr:unnamed protein product [Amoebophrya sp. A120]|eukprot:GSA120T00002962001.1
MCTKCTAVGFHLNAGTSKCDQNVCTCDTGGSPATGEACTTDGAHLCSSCEDGFHATAEDKCVANACTCDHGTALTGPPTCVEHGVTPGCDTCLEGYEKVDLVCVTTTTTTTTTTTVTTTVTTTSTTGFLASETEPGILPEDEVIEDERPAEGEIEEEKPEVEVEEDKKDQVRSFDMGVNIPADPQEAEAVLNSAEFKNSIATGLVKFFQEKGVTDLKEDQLENIQITLEKSSFSSAFLSSAATASFATDQDEAGAAKNSNPREGISRGRMARIRKSGKDARVLRFEDKDQDAARTDGAAGLSAEEVGQKKVFNKRSMSNIKVQFTIHPSANGSSNQAALLNNAWPSSTSSSAGSANNAGAGPIGGAGPLVQAVNTQVAKSPGLANTITVVEAEDESTSSAPDEQEHSTPFPLNPASGSGETVVYEKSITININKNSSGTLSTGAIAAIAIICLVVLVGIGFTVMDPTKLGMQGVPGPELAREIDESSSSSEEEQKPPAGTPPAGSTSPREGQQPVPGLQQQSVTESPRGPQDAVGASPRGPQDAVGCSCRCKPARTARIDYHFCAARTASGRRCGRTRKHCSTGRPSYVRCCRGANDKPFRCGRGKRHRSRGTTAAGCGRVATGRGKSQEEKAQSQGGRRGSRGRSFRRRRRQYCA